MPHRFRLLRRQAYQLMPFEHSVWLLARCQIEAKGLAPREESRTARRQKSYSKKKIVPLTIVSHVHFLLVMIDIPR